MVNAKCSRKSQLVVVVRPTGRLHSKSHVWTVEGERKLFWKPAGEAKYLLWPSERGARIVFIFLFSFSLSLPSRRLEFQMVPL